uniref:Uncharacterized protein n=1 Tax=Fagus sylvatica TaxID=28930 RepID=A0A2N9FCI0_FAGSY
MSKPRVTITLGRSGQVVKREGNVSGYGYGQAGTKPVTGGKRSGRERLGGNANGSWLPMNKRQRRDGINWRRSDNGVHDTRISPNDLRLKLMRKRLKQIPRAVEVRRNMDRRQKLSKTIQPSVRRNMQQQRPESTGRNLLWQMVPTERSRSPDRNLNSYRGLSPQRDFDELPQVPSLRAADNSRGRWFLSNDGASRPTGSTPLRVKGPPETSKQVTQLAPISGIELKSLSFG